MSNAKHISKTNLLKRLKDTKNMKNISIEIDLDNIFILQRLTLLQIISKSQQFVKPEKNTTFRVNILLH